MLSPPGAPTNSIDNVLAPPETWTVVPDQKGPVAYVEIPPSSAEYGVAVDAFLSGLPKYSTGAKVLKLERVQNRGMWQAFAVKKQEYLHHEDHRDGQWAAIRRCAGQ